MSLTSIQKLALELLKQDTSGSFVFYWKDGRYYFVTSRQHNVKNSFSRKTIKSLVDKGIIKHTRDVGYTLSVDT